MQEIIEQVLEAEEKAKKKIEESRKMATDIKAKAEETAGSLLADAREEAASILQDSVKKAKEESETSLKKVIAQEESSEVSFLETFRSKIDLLSERIVDLVITAEFRKG